MTEENVQENATTGVMSEQDFMALVGGVGVEAKARTFHIPEGDYIMTLGQVETKTGEDKDNRPYLAKVVKFKVSSFPEDAEYFDDSGEPIAPADMESYKGNTVQKFNIFYADDRLGTIEAAAALKHAMNEIGLVISAEDDVFARLAEAEQTAFRIRVYNTVDKKDSSRINSNISFKDSNILDA